MAFLSNMKKRAERIFARVGRRGSYLFFLALLDMLYGYSLLIQQGPLFQQENLFLTPMTWGWIWVGVACVLAVEAFRRVDRLGYTVAVLIKFVWASLALYNFVFTPDDPRGWIAVVIWYAFSILTAIVSNWPEHKMPQVGVFNGEDD